jgi:hypothetical protein
VARLHQGSGAGYSRQAGTYDGDVFGRCVHVFSKVKWSLALYTLQSSRLALIDLGLKQAATLKSTDDHFTKIR